MIADAYKFYSDRNSIPRGRSYVTLCNRQPDTHGSEIVQHSESGFIKKNQFIGIDDDCKIIKENKALHPEAVWLCGEFSKVIRHLSDKNQFHPSIVYYDSTHVVSSNVGLKRLADVMNRCEDEQVLVVANVLLEDTRSKRHLRGLFPENYIVENIWDELFPSERRLWESYDIDTNTIFVYRSRKATMGTHFFYKEKNK